MKGDECGWLRRAGTTLPLNLAAIACESIVTCSGLKADEGGEAGMQETKSKVAVNKMSGLEVSIRVLISLG